MVQSRSLIPCPANFSFLHTALSHGWYALPPFSYDKTGQRLSRVLRLGDGTLASATLTGGNGVIHIEADSAARLTSGQMQAVTRQVTTCLRLDEDFSGFHAEARKHPEFRWIPRAGAGRMLRAPTAFEDVVKMICTTNCTWALTTLMVTNLVQKYGEHLDGPLYAFPVPESIAGSSDRELRNDIKAGYRSPYLLELAENVASGRLSVESWRHSPLNTEELFDEMVKVKGIGPYAVGNIMKLVGRYDYLGLDSWVRSQYYKLHHRGRKVKDSTIERHYERLGRWRGLFFWLEMTRYWHEDKFLL